MKAILIKILIALIATGVIISTAVQSEYFKRNAGILKTDEGFAERLNEQLEIDTAFAELKEISNDITIMGQIVFHEKINISSKLNGRLNRINIQEGKRVRKRELLAEVERLPLEITLAQQRSELDIAVKSYELSSAKYENALKSIEIKLKTIIKAKVDLNDKKVSYENMDRILMNKLELLEAGGISESEVKTLRTQHTTLYTKLQLARSDYEIQLVGYRDEDIKAVGLDVPKSEADRLKIIKKINTRIERAELASARSRIKQAENNIKSTNIMLRETYIRSPINGIVASKNMEAGEMIKADSIIAVLISISRVFVALNVNEKDLKDVKIGQNVVFTVDALGSKTFRGKINRISPVLDIKTRTVEVKADVRNSGYLLKPGMFARAVINTGTAGKKLMVPISSLIKKINNDGDIYIVKKGLVFKQRVKLGKEYSDEIEVMNGLDNKDLIIVKGLNLVFPGMNLRDYNYNKKDKK